MVCGLASALAAEQADLVAVLAKAGSLIEGVAATWAGRPCLPCIWPAKGPRLPMLLPAHRIDFSPDCCSRPNCSRCLAASMSKADLASLFCVVSYVSDVLLTWEVRLWGCCLPRQKS